MNTLSYIKPQPLNLDSVVLTPIKKCTKCGEIKPFSGFYKCKKEKFGIRSQCKYCINHKNKKYRENHYYEIKKQRKSFRDSNKEKLYLKNKIYREKKRQILREKKKQYYRDNIKKVREYREKNRYKINKTANDYRRRNRDAINKKAKERYHNDTLFKLSKNIRNRIASSFKRGVLIKNRKTIDFIGITYNELRDYIELQFKNGMSWENRNEWHIDHIVPLTLAKTEDELYKLSHYSNLRPIWNFENLMKYNKLLPEHEELYKVLLNR